MESIFKYLRSIGVAALLLAPTAALWARSTGTAPARTAPDTWCVGKAGAEVCVDADGNLLPTTTNDATLGTSSLRWSTIYGTAFSASGAVTFTGTVVIPQVDITVSSPTVVGQLIRTSSQVVYVSTNITDLGGWVKVGGQ